MTNRELLTVVQPALSACQTGEHPNLDLDGWDGVQTTALRYGVTENLKRVQGALESYEAELQSLLEEHDVEPTPSGGIPSGAPQAFQESLDDLLDKEAPFEPYSITEEEIKGEESLPYPIISALTEHFVED